LNPISETVKYSGIVVTFNEATRLRECMQSLDFCQEIVVVDLGSKDASVEIAEEMGARVIHHPHVQIVEEVRAEAAAYAENDWLAMLDPDEVFPKSRIGEINEIVNSTNNVGIVAIPTRNYFLGKPLYSTRWGLVQHKPRIVNRDRVRFESDVHAGILIKTGYEKKYLPYRRDSEVIKHYWVDSIPDMISKHVRYVKKEGKARYNRGERFSLRMWRSETRQALRENLVEYKGLKGGMAGIFLSIFYAIYTFFGIYYLYKYESSLKKKRNDG